MSPLTKSNIFSNNYTSLVEKSYNLCPFFYLFRLTQSTAMWIFFNQCTNFQFSKFEVQGFDIAILLGAEGPRKGPKGPRGPMCPSALRRSQKDGPVAPRSSSEYIFQISQGDKLLQLQTRGECSQYIIINTSFILLSVVWSTFKDDSWGTDPEAKWGWKKCSSQ